MMSIQSCHDSGGGWYHFSRYLSDFLKDYGDSVSNEISLSKAIMTTNFNNFGPRPNTPDLILPSYGYAPVEHFKKYLEHSIQYCNFILW
jgi:hypothetical protein